MNSCRKSSQSKHDQKKLACYYFQRGYCRYGDGCRFRHDIPESKPNSSLQNADTGRLNDESSEKTCGICFEEIIKKKKGFNQFAILPNCKHCFCFSCIQMWRSSIHFDDEVTKSCPECRTNCIYVYKNSFWVENEDKEKFIADSNKKLAKINCKFYKGGRGVCRLGSKCLYRHYPKSSVSGGNGPSRSTIFEDENDSSSSFASMLIENGYVDYEDFFIIDGGYLFHDLLEDDFSPYDSDTDYESELSAFYI